LPQGVGKGGEETVFDKRHCKNLGERTKKADGDRRRKTKYMGRDLSREKIKKKKPFTGQHDQEAQTTRSEKLARRAGR